ncbi:MAG: hypothetical protein AAGA09_03295 [Pseudomonadota bacterium]
MTILDRTSLSLCVFVLSALLPASAQQIEGIGPCQVQGGFARAQVGDIRLVGSPVAGVSAIAIKLSYQFDLSETAQLVEYTPIEGATKAIQIDMIGTVDRSTYDITYLEAHATISGFQQVEAPSLSTGRYYGIYLNTSTERVSTITVMETNRDSKVYNGKLSAEIIQNPDITGEDDWRRKLEVMGAGFVDADLRNRKPMHIWFADYQGTGVKASLDTSSFNVADNEVKVKEVAKGLIEQAQSFQCNPFPG